MPILTPKGTAVEGRRTITLTLLTLLAALLLLGACSPMPATAQASIALCPPVGTTSPGPAATTSLLGVLPTLQKSAQAMRELSSVHFQFQGKATFGGGGAGLPAAANTATATLSGSGDASLALKEAQAQLRLTLQSSRRARQTLTVAIRLLGQKLYLRGPTHHWLALDLAQLAGAFQTITGRLPQSQDLLAEASHVTAVDHGVCMLSAKAVHHLTLSLEKAGLAPGASTTGIPTGIAVDLFLDQETSRLLRIEITGVLRGNVNALLAALQRPLPAQRAQPPLLTATFELVLTFSSFNQSTRPVVAPAQASPIDLRALLAGA